jgi:hypothetical protein
VHLTEWGASSPATGCRIILYVGDKQLNKDPRNEAANKSDPQPKHVSLHASQQNYKQAQKAHQGGEDGL